MRWIDANHKKEAVGSLAVIAEKNHPAESPRTVDITGQRRQRHGAIKFGSFRQTVVQCLVRLAKFSGQKAANLYCRNEIFGYVSLTLGRLSRKLPAHDTE